MANIMDILNTIWCRSYRFHRVLLILLLVESGLIPGGQYGFWCGDLALSYPYTGDTIGWKWLVTTAIVLPLIVLLLVERMYSPDKDWYRSRALRWYEDYLYGLVVNITVIETLKLIVGSPRPHFFETCVPLEAKSCMPTEFITNYHCTKKNWLKQSDRSFPSGHTSLALHLSLFLAYYLERRVPSPCAMTRTFQLALVSSAVFCARSRITDNRHHLVDVVAGIFIALPLVGYTIFSLCKNFETLSDEATQYSSEIVEESFCRAEKNVNALENTAPTAREET